MNKQSIINIFLLLVFLAACGGPAMVKTLPSDDPFYEKTRFIMTKDEKKIYKHLPDQEARDAFIEEFWEKRDPSPGTTENEMKLEYEDRIEFADKTFKEKPGGRGWDTDRGQMLLLLGFPEERNQHTTTRRGTTWQINIEEWRYYSLEIFLRFIDDGGMGQFRMQYWPSHLNRVLERVALTPDLVKRDSAKNAFSFKAKHKAGHLVLTVPVKRISFEEADGRMAARFEVEMYVYRDYKKADHVKSTETVSGPAADILARKEIEVRVPYQLVRKGKYYFDVIVREVMTGSRYRNVCRAKR